MSSSSHTYTIMENGKSIVVAHLMVPDGDMDKASIDRFAHTFRNGIGQHASKARCSRCYGDEKCLLDPKPASLKRHLYHHFHIMCFECSFPGCTQQFVTKDQTVVHVMKHHAVEKDRDRATTYVFPIFPDQLD